MTALIGLYFVIGIIAAIVARIIDYSFDETGVLVVLIAWPFLMVILILWGLGKLIIGLADMIDTMIRMRKNR